MKLPGIEPKTVELKTALGTATLYCDGSYSVFAANGDEIRFVTSPRLVGYTRIKRWCDGCLEVGADYGNGEIEDYIDIRQILENLYYDADAFLGKIEKVEVRHGRGKG